MAGFPPAFTKKDVPVKSGAANPFAKQTDNPPAGMKGMLAKRIMSHKQQGKKK